MRQLFMRHMQAANRLLRVLPMLCNWLRRSSLQVCLVGCSLLGGLAQSSMATEGSVEPLQYSQIMPEQKAARSLLLDIAQAGSRLVAVGDRGHIVYSDDNGVTWVQAKVPTRQMLTAVFFLDAKHGWVTGHDSLILATVDGGLTWSQQFVDLDYQAPLLDIYFTNAEHGLAVGAYGRLLETNDAGALWTDVSDRLDNEDQRHLNALTEIQGSGLFAVGEMGSMYRSTDLGQTWQTLSGPYEGSLFGVSGTRENAAVVVYGLRGHVFRSADFGNSWQPVNLTGSDDVSNVSLASSTLLADGSLVIVGQGGIVLKSTDSGHSFSVVNRPDRLALSAVSADGRSGLVLVGQGGVHVTTATGSAVQQ
jgi:photosystem II stability/assembly factor-like uncharacterized protein